MALIDIILLVILGGFVLSGLWFGFIHTFGSLIGIIAGAWVAGNYFSVVADYGSFIWGDGDLGAVISFVLILVIVNRLVGLLFYFFDRIFDIISIIPFLTSINRLLGGLAGFLEGMFTIGLVLFFIARYPLGDWVTGQLVSSRLAGWFVDAASFLAPLLPAVLKQLQSVI